MKRLLSLDVFRGMTIFLMIVVNTPGSWSYVYPQLLHAKWDGCKAPDLVFPFFLFIVGVSMYISFSKFSLSQLGLWRSKAITRGLKIIGIGLLLNWFPFYTKNIVDLRLFGVLPRIGLAFMVGALLVSIFNHRQLIFLSIGILIAYYLLLVGFGDLTLEGNIVRKVDLLLFGESHIYKGYGIPFDPEGLLSTIPCVAQVIIGFLVASKFYNHDRLDAKIKTLFAFGIILLPLGLAWHFLGFPINKPIWSSSYVLFTCGLGAIILAAMMWMIDARGFTRWTYIFKAFGQNPLVCFVLSGLFVKIMLLITIDDMNLYKYLYTYGFQANFGDYLGSFIFALSYTMFIWLIAFYLERKNIMIKV